MGGVLEHSDSALDLLPEAARLLAASLGLSRRYTGDLEQLEAGLLYDTLYRWARDASHETHSYRRSRRTYLCCVCDFFHDDRVEFKASAGVRDAESRKTKG